MGFVIFRPIGYAWKDCTQFAHGPRNKGNRENRATTMVVLPPPIGCYFSNKGVEFDAVTMVPPTTVPRRDEFFDRSKTGYGVDNY